MTSEDRILAELDDLANAAAEELAAASVPELRRAEDVTLDEYIIAAKKRGVEFTGRRQAACWLIANADVERVDVWDPRIQTMMTVYRWKQDGEAVKDQSTPD